MTSSLPQASTAQEQKNTTVRAKKARTEIDPTDLPDLCTPPRTLDFDQKYPKMLQGNFEKIENKLTSIKFSA